MYIRKWLFLNLVVNSAGPSIDFREWSLFMGRGGLVNGENKD
jgi:hypothetical protein